MSKYENLSYTDLPECRRIGCQHTVAQILECTPDLQVKNEVGYCADHAYSMDDINRCGWLELYRDDRLTTVRKAKGLEP